MEFEKPVLSPKPANFNQITSGSATVCTLVLFEACLKLQYGFVAGPYSTKDGKAFHSNEDEHGTSAEA